MGWEEGKGLDDPRADPHDKWFALWHGFPRARGYFACLLRRGALGKRASWSALAATPGVLQGSSRKAAVLPAVACKVYESLARGEAAICSASVPRAALTQGSLVGPARVICDEGADERRDVCLDFESEEEPVALHTTRGALAAVAIAAQGTSSPSSDGAFETDDEAIPVRPSAAQPPSVSAAGRESQAAFAAPPRLGDRPARREELQPLFAEWEAAGVPETVEGVAMRIEARVRACGRFVYIRRRVRCPNPAHGHLCNRSRSVLAPTGGGPLDPVGYLGAWVRAGVGDELHGASRAAHQAYAPTLAEARAWLRDNGYAAP